MKLLLTPQHNERYTHTRIFIHPACETPLENLLERNDRPYRQWRKDVLPEVLSQLNLPADTRVRWSQFAGCTLCPCSPGFILNVSLARKDVHVVLGEENAQ
jgi:hypothetical protein